MPRRRGHWGSAILWSLHGVLMSSKWESGPVNAAVVGVERMGQHHARNYAAIEGYKLVGVVDMNAENGQKAADAYKCRAFATVEELLHFCRENKTPLHAASVAVPTLHHRSVAQSMLAAGVDLLIEKPLAPTVADARAIVELARANSCVLQVGHTERFNPLPAGARCGNMTSRPPSLKFVPHQPHDLFVSIDIGVVLDMMIHDIRHRGTTWSAAPWLMCAVGGGRHRAA